MKNILGGTSDPPESIMSINTKLRISLTQKLNLTGRNLNSVFKPIDFLVLSNMKPYSHNTPK